MPSAGVLRVSSQAFVIGADLLIMREVAQWCRYCGCRFFVRVDAWSDRPGLQGLAVCPGCDRSARIRFESRWQGVFQRRLSRGEVVGSFVVAGLLLYFLRLAS